MPGGSVHSTSDRRDTYLSTVQAAWDELRASHQALAGDVTPAKSGRSRLPPQTSPSQQIPADNAGDVTHAESAGSRSAPQTSPSQQLLTDDADDDVPYYDAGGRSRPRTSSSQQLLIDDADDDVSYYDNTTPPTLLFLPLDS